MSCSSADAAGTILIVGASRGIGYAMAAQFLARGWHVTGTARNPARSDLYTLADDHGGTDAPLTIEEAVPKVVDVLLAQRGKPGLRFLDREGRTVPW